MDSLEALPWKQHGRDAICVAARLEKHASLAFAGLYL